MDNNISAFFNAACMELESNDSMNIDENEPKYTLRSAKLKKGKRELPEKSRKLNFTSFFYPIKEQGSQIIGRETEAKEIISMLEQPQGGMRPLLIGPSGIGKNSVILKVIELYMSLNKVIGLATKHFYCIDCPKLASEYPYENPAEDIVEYLKDLKQDLERADQNNAVVVFKNIDILMAIPQVAGYMDILFKEKTRFIGSIYEEPENEAIQKICNILYRNNFAKLEIKESPLEDIYKIVANYMGTHERFYGGNFTNEGIQLAVKLSAKHFTTRPLPIRAINAINECSSKIMIENALLFKNDKITEKEVSQFFSTKTGIPQEDLLEDSIFNKRKFALRLKANIVGQDYAIAQVAAHAAAFKLGLLKENKPWGVFLFVGPTGVGKTELATQLAKKLFNTSADMIVLNGSEYKESHSASNLIGAPRGYEGHDLGGMLTAPLIENPYRVVLFDEFEKAHDDVRKIFLQVFDKGFLKDRRGKEVDCRKSLFLLTSNLGSSEFFSQKNSEQFSHEELINALKPILVEHLSAEMCGRFTKIIPFQPIKREHLIDLAEVELKRIKENLIKQTAIDLHWTGKLVHNLSTIDVDLRFGGRLFCETLNTLITNAIQQKTESLGQHLKGKIILDINTNNEILVIQK